ncbi:hypothetical protein OG417_39215 [Actinoallomurus sp. NBC_01490]|uniref:hypothetical protein n=1 Tax=Actinoallomurus sp. NBC_01490 TaxID=2903557 RepID=UPI002E37FACD|nr:hypothetical protein [Actinoallomurus sp. NBC_01490]
MTDPFGRFPYVALLSLALTAACSGSGVSARSSPASTAGGTRTRSGTLRGHLYAVGGPAPGHRWALPGSITVSGNGTEWEVKVDSDGGYSMTMSPGRYVVTGHSPDFNDGAVPCSAPNPAQVGNGRTTTLNVYCQMR